ncbi:MAG TPA: endonuclease, partial [Mycobacteriales bacterium]
LGRGHYRRYDERTSTQLGDGARLLLDRWRGDLRRLHDHAGGDVGRLRAGLKELPGIGDTGANVFLREAQAVWPDLRPFVDSRTARGAAEIGLPTEPAELARLVPGQDLPRLVVGLVRVSLDRTAAEELRTEHGHRPK